MPRIEVSDETYEKIKHQLSGGDEIKPGEALRIAIVDNRGLTFVGFMDLGGDSEWIMIKRARCIIQWGTSKHIAELGNGPLPNTRLGATKTILVRRNNIILVQQVCGDWYE